MWSHSCRGNTRQRKADCLACPHTFAFPDMLASRPEHRLFAIEYRCVTCYPSIEGRQFKALDAADLARAASAAERLADIEAQLTIPDDEIPAGDETSRLPRWGYHKFRDLFDDRQLLGLGLLLDTIRGIDDVRVRHALATVFSDFLRYQDLLGRYDTCALKCHDIFSVHGFPGRVDRLREQTHGHPPGRIGIVHPLHREVRQGEGVRQAPYEILPGPGRKKIVPAPGESIEAPLVCRESDAAERAAWINCAPSQDVALLPGSLDGVFTDPPYFANVQHAELMDFSFVWLRLLLAGEGGGFAGVTTRSDHELTGNDTRGGDIEDFTAGLSEVFCRMAKAMKPGAPLVFTYHQNEAAYAPLVVALLDAGFTCAMVLPAPAEMATSLHILGTKSSILDSVFVCRHRAWVAENADAAPTLLMSLAERVANDVAAMADAGYRCTSGDVPVPERRAHGRRQDSLRTGIHDRNHRHQRAMTLMDRSRR